MLRRELTRNEKILLTVLVVILLALGYKMVVYDTTQATIAAAQATQEQAEADILVETAKSIRLERMREELAALDSGQLSNPSIIPDYDNLAPLVSFLNGLLADADEYNMSQTVSPQGNYVRRTVQLHFSCTDYDTAKAIVRSLYDCPYRCSIEGLSLAANSQGGLGTVLDLTTAGGVSVNLTAIFTERVS